MWKYLLLIIALIVSSCSGFRSRVYTDITLPPIIDNEPLVIYTNEKALPDSANQIGEIDIFFKAGDFSRFSYKKMLLVLEKDAKEHGANAVVMQKIKDNDHTSAIFKADLYSIEPLRRIIFDKDTLFAELKKDTSNPIKGIYEIEISNIYDSDYEDDFLRYACIEDEDSNLVLVYIDGFEKVEGVWAFWDVKRIWRQGDIFAELTKTINKNIYKAKYYHLTKALVDNALFKFESGNLRGYLKSGLHIYRKTYPIKSKYEEYIGSSSGIIFSDNRLITSYHAVDEKDCKIFIKGINGDFDNKYEAVVEKYDDVSDIAVLRLKDSTLFFENYNVLSDSKQKFTGEDIFVLGFPLSLYMGEEVKLTNGIISSQSGYAGDIASYQISAPIQPGNSGGPLFDKSGYLIGMISSGMTAAENVGYATKVDIINKFLMDNGYNTAFNNGNDLSKLELSEKIKPLQKSVVMVELIKTKKKIKKKRKNLDEEDAFELEW